MGGGVGVMLIYAHVNDVGLYCNQWWQQHKIWPLVSDWLTILVLDLCKRL